MLKRIPAWVVVAGVAGVAGAAVAVLSAQPVTRHATNIAALLAYPSFFHQRPILIVGTVTTTSTGEMRVADDEGSLHLVLKGTTAPDGLDEVRGEFWDLGRMKSDDVRLQNMDLRTVFHIDPDAPWPKTGEVTAIVATAVTSAPSPPLTPTIRAIVLDSARYLDQKVTIAGQFSGRNLLGDLPNDPARSRYDFVLREADAAIWVVNMRPKTKDFELQLDSRLETGRWLQVAGIVRQARGLQWIDAEAGTLAAAKPPAETVEAEAPIRVPAAPPPEVIFSAPTEDETDVSLGSSVRIQFSRDLEPATLKGHIRVRYLDSQTAERGEPVTPTAEFTALYSAANRELELKFAKPLERFRTVKVDLQDGILGTDQQSLKPWTLTFTLGGS